MNLKSALFGIIFFCVGIQLSAQIIVVDPAEPNVNDNITITFDATQGSGGLSGVSPVYMHTGVITDKSASSSDWKYVVSEWGVDDPKVLMTAIGNNKHQISYNIKDYYGVPATEEVLKMAFVFRNVDGTKEGKTDGGDDIFYDIFPDPDAFTSSFDTPTESNLFVRPGQVMPIKVKTSFVSDIQLFLNNDLLKEENTDFLNYTLFINSQTGTNVVKYIAQFESQTLQDSFHFTVVPTTLIEDLPMSSELGVQVIDQQTVRFNLEAPGKSFVYLLGDFNNWKLNEQYLLKNTTDKKNWWMDISGLDPNMEYGYQYAVNGDVRIADPYAEKVLDPWNDQFISEETYPNLKPYPKDETYGIVGTFQINEEDFNWTDEAYVRPPADNLVIYELLLRDFTDNHDFKTVTDSLAYFEKLGINTIDLMPVNEFDGNISWGYNPSYHMALDKYYGTAEDLKTLVNEAHNKGIAVILDVVFNHATGSNPLAAMFWDSENNKTSPENPWFNVDARHPFNVFHDMNHEYEGTKNYVKKILQYWIEEFHVDGFRFDLSKGFTQTFSDNSFDMGKYDQSRIDILKDYADFMWSVDPETFIILEHFADYTEEVVLSEYGLMSWFNGSVAMGEAALGYNSGNKSDFSFLSYMDINYSNPTGVGYMESHDEERMMYKNLEFGNSSGDYNVKDLLTALQRVELTACFLFSIPGPKMMWQFGELGYDKSIFECTNGSMNENCKLDPKDPVWEYLSESARKRLFDVFRAIIHLKTTYPTFRTEDYQTDLNSEKKGIRLNHPDMNALLWGNFDVVSQDIEPGFLHPGTWYEYFSGESIEVVDTAAALSFNPGEYRLYTNVELEQPDITSSVFDLSYKNGANILVYPNPSHGDFKILIDTPYFETVFMELIDIQGNNHSKSKVSLYRGMQEVDLPGTLDLKAGMYILSVRGAQINFSSKIIIQ
jgi:glycosidase